MRAFELRRIAQHWWVLLIAGIVSLGFGIAALDFYPALSLSFAVVWSALWLMTGGVLESWLAFQEKHAQLPWGLTLTFGLVAFVAGVLALAYPLATISALMGLLSAFGLVGGAIMLVAAGRHQSVERDARQAIHHAIRT
ncbi:MAG TPA: DUF308 domain-containing protein [Gemmatimonadaceae bacterium]|nr:DUF308 domain-containing protein [Gemmatimonadaceae bacterium]